MIPDNVVRRRDQRRHLAAGRVRGAVRACARRTSPRPAGARSLALFEAIGDALLVIIDWVLWIAPLGVFALAYTVGSAAGGAAFAGLGHYVVLISVIGILVTLACYPLAMIRGADRPRPISPAAMVAPRRSRSRPARRWRRFRRCSRRVEDDGRSRRGRRRHAADLGGVVPGDRSGDEHGGGLLRRALARASSRASPR